MARTVLVFVLAACTAARADVIHVPDDFATIQAGINAAVDGDEVVVADGTWRGAGNNNLDFRGRLIKLRSASGDPAVCIINAAGGPRAFVFRTGETSEAIVDGFTIERGLTAFLCQGSSPTVRNCVFRRNGSDRGGAMANVDGSAPSVIGCTFVDNGAFTGGGAMWNAESSPNVIGCTFVENRTSAECGPGGGMWNELSSPMVVDCTFIANEVGGGMANTDSDPRVIGCTFRGNEATCGGGGMRNERSHPIVSRCTFDDNRALGPEGGGGMRNVDSHPAITGSRFRWNEASAVVSVGDAPTIAGTLFCGNEPFHVEGDWVDEGANVFQDDCACVGDLDDDGAVGLEDLALLLATFGDKCGEESCPDADLDGDGVVAFPDLLTLLTAWGLCP